MEVAEGTSTEMAPYARVEPLRFGLQWPGKTPEKQTHAGLEGTEGDDRFLNLSPAP